MQYAKIKYTLFIIFLFLLMTGCKNQSANDSSESNTQSEILSQITDEKVTFSCLACIDEELLNISDFDLNNTPFFKELENRTNVHIDWIITTGKNYFAQYDLLLASGNAPDLIFHFYNSNFINYNLDVDIENGNCLDLTDLIPIYAPNYYGLITSSDKSVKKTVFTNSGRMAGIYSIFKEKQGAYVGLQIRKDWLDELNLEIPVTYDDLEAVLTAFKERKGAAAPLALPTYTIDNSLSAGFGVTNSFFQINGTVYYGPYEENWRDYLSLLQSWYKKGLIDPNFATGGTYYSDPVLITSGASGVWCSMNTLISSSFLPAMEENAKIIAIPSPKKNADDRNHIRVPDQYVGSYYTISANCREPEIALKWMDYLYSESGSLFANYGIEGLTFEFSEDEIPRYTNYILDNPDGLSANEAMEYYTMPPNFPGLLVDWKRELQILPENDRKTYDIWETADTEYLLPAGISLTSKENIELNNIMEDIENYMNEMTLRFIMGTESLDKYDIYIAELRNKNIERAIEIYQQAYDRYNISP